jgi:hypothetical protein
VLLTDKQIQLLEAKRAEEAQAHLQTIEKGAIDIEISKANLEKAKTSTAGAEGGANLSPGLRRTSPCRTSPKP